MEMRANNTMLATISSELIAPEKGKSNSKLAMTASNA